jgi:hypothetical protein
MEKFTEIPFDFHSLKTCVPRGWRWQSFNSLFFVFLHITFAFLFWWHWGMKSGHHTC